MFSKKGSFQKGVDGQISKNIEFWKGKQKENKEKLNRKKRMILKAGLLWKPKRKNLSFLHKKQRETRKKNPPKNQKNLLTRICHVVADFELSHRLPMSFKST